MRGKELEYQQWRSQFSSQESAFKVLSDQLQKLKIQPLPDIQNMHNPEQRNQEECANSVMQLLKLVSDTNQNSYRLQDQMQRECNEQSQLKNETENNAKYIASLREQISQMEANQKNLYNQEKQKQVQEQREMKQIKEQLLKMQQKISQNDLKQKALEKKEQNLQNKLKIAQKNSNPKDQQIEMNGVIQSQFQYKNLQEDCKDLVQRRFETIQKENRIIREVTRASHSKFYDIMSTQLKILTFLEQKAGQDSNRLVLKNPSQIFDSNSSGILQIYQNELLKCRNITELTKIRQEHFTNLSNLEIQSYLKNENKMVEILSFYRHQLSFIEKVKIRKPSEKSSLEYLRCKDIFSRNEEEKQQNEMQSGSFGQNSPQSQQEVYNNNIAQQQSEQQQNNSVEVLNSVNLNQMQETRQPQINSFEQMFVNQQSNIPLTPLSHQKENYASVYPQQWSQNHQNCFYSQVKQQQQDFNLPFYSQQQHLAQQSQFPLLSSCYSQQSQNSIYNPLNQQEASLQKSHLSQSYYSQTNSAQYNVQGEDPMEIEEEMKESSLLSHYVQSQCQIQNKQSPTSQISQLSISKPTGYMF